MPGKLVNITYRIANNGNCDTAPAKIASSNKSERYLSCHIRPRSSPVNNNDRQEVDDFCDQMIKGMSNICPYHGSSNCNREVNLRP
jgi:hypothetical protein